MQKRIKTVLEAYRRCGDVRCKECPIGNSYNGDSGYLCKLLTEYRERLRSKLNREIDRL